MSEETLRSIVLACIEEASKAPSSHNSQPWKFKVQEHADDDNLTVDVFADGTLRLVRTDIDGRELMISCGAVLYSLTLAIRSKGYSCEVNYANISQCKIKEAFLVASILVKSKKTTTTAGDDNAEALIRQIPKRVTYRGDFSTNKLAESELEAISKAIASEEGAWLQIVSPERRKLLADMIYDANDLQWRDPAWRNELASWVRPYSSGDGLHIGPGILSPVVRLFISWFKFVGDFQGTNDRNLALAGPVLAVIGCSSADPISWLKLGQALQKGLLVASSMDIFVSFFNQPLQVQQFGGLAVSEIIDRPAGYPCLIIRLGKVDNSERVRANHSARRPLEQILI